MVTNGYELAVQDILVIGTGAQLKIGPNSVVKVEGMLLLKDGVNLSIEAREMIIGPNCTCIAKIDTTIADSVYASADMAIESVLQEDFTGSPIVPPGLYCYNFYGTCDEWNALNQLFYHPHKLSSEIPCAVGNSAIDNVLL